ncbi:MAG: type II toxin-antitoxin system VapC family toxin [Verrucomicrobia bacterium]|nr:MAG: type II toxin-antitoxin system VapC family toxin [Verrucomicrobiota bacterium]
MLLDTNAISAWAKGDAALLQALRPDRTWYLPSIALGEYRYGLLKSTRRAELEAWLESVEAACVVLAADGATARHYAELRRALDAGQGEVPYHDIWIGALALQHNVEVVSRDAHFDKMPGVRRIGW